MKIKRNYVDARRAQHDAQQKCLLTVHNHLRVTPIYWFYVGNDHGVIVQNIFVMVFLIGGLYHLVLTPQQRHVFILSTITVYVNHFLATRAT